MSLPEARDSLKDRKANERSMVRTCSCVLWVLGQLKWDAIKINKSWHWRCYGIFWFQKKYVWRCLKIDFGIFLEVRNLDPQATQFFRLDRERARQCARKNSPICRWQCRIIFFSVQCRKTSKTARTIQMDRKGQERSGRFWLSCFWWWCRSSSGDIAKSKRMFHLQDGDIQR